MKTNKQLKNECKFYKSQKGVFQIRNKTNGKIFVGSNIDLKAIWNRQKTQLNFGNHQNDVLQKDWKLLGEESFSYEIIFEIKEVEGKEIDIRKELKILEQLFLDELQPFDEKGYNKRKANLNVSH